MSRCTTFRSTRSSAPPLPPDLRRVAAGAAGRPADQRPRPPLRADPAQRQRRRLRPGARRGRLRGPLRARDEPHAAALGLSDTHYANPVGLDEKGNYSSADDLDRARPPAARRSRPSPRSPTPGAALLHSVHPPRRIETINDLLLEAPWATGVKTGHTFGADYVLVGSGRRKGVELISAVHRRVRTESGRDLEHTAPARIRLLALPQRHPDPRRPGPRRTVDPLRGRRAAAARVARRWRSACARGQRCRRRRCGRRQEVEGPIRRGDGARDGDGRGRRDAGRERAAARRRAASSRASALDRARSFVADNPSGSRWRCPAILVAALFVSRRRTR